ncbi:DUF3087 family protein [Oceanospirillum maris]|jgi:hypothetical protein|uniref:DUF3087 family protein n=1 Tax=Oceanospirillum maris TaxID=64977 RepID=UPI0004143B14|nr:DUF3087 family protein [Oceanospirillum maris]
MQIHDIDKTHYLKLSRKVSMVLIICFAITALGSSPILIHFWGNEDGGNFYLNLTGVLIGVLCTGSVFYTYKDDPRLVDLLYIFRLKRMLARVTNRMHHLKELAEKNDQDAQRILRFYYEGLMQVYHIESNEYGYTELVKDKDLFYQTLSDELKAEPLLDLQPEIINEAAQRNV